MAIVLERSRRIATPAVLALLLALGAGCARAPGSHILLITVDTTRPDRLTP